MVGDSIDTERDDDRHGPIAQRDLLTCLGRRLRIDGTESHEVRQKELDGCGAVLDTSLFRRCLIALLRREREESDLAAFVGEEKLGQDLHDETWIGIVDWILRSLGL